MDTNWTNRFVTVQRLVSSVNWPIIWRKQEWFMWMLIGLKMNVIWFWMGRWIWMC